MAVFATRESIVKECDEALFQVMKAQRELERAIKYHTRMEITLEIMDRDEEAE